METALKERAYHSNLFLSYTKEAACEITVRVYQSKKIIKPLRDIRYPSYQNLHQPQDYSQSQVFGFEMKQANEWGIIYYSVRHIGGECVAILRPPAVPLPVIQTKHFNLVWNGNNITTAFEVGGEIYELENEFA